MSNETNALQVNFKTPAGSLFNVYGKTPEEFEFNLQCFRALIGDIIAAENAVRAGVVDAPVSAVATVQASLGGAVIDDTPVWAAKSPNPQEINAHTPAPASASVTPAASSGNPSCRHGAMSWVAPANKPWKGWFCPQPKEATDKCPPQFVKG